MVVELVTGGLITIGSIAFGLLERRKRIELGKKLELVKTELEGKIEKTEKNAKLWAILLG